MGKLASVFIVIITMGFIYAEGPLNINEGIDHSKEPGIGGALQVQVTNLFHQIAVALGISRTDPHWVFLRRSLTPGSGIVGAIEGAVRGVKKRSTGMVVPLGIRKRRAILVPPFIFDLIFNAAGVNRTHPIRKLLDELPIVGV